MAAIQNDKQVKESYYSRLDSVRIHFRLLSSEYNEMLFTEWMELADSLQRDNCRKIKAEFQNSAFIAWLLGAGKEGKSFESYCISLGISEKKVVSNNQRLAEIKRAEEVAARVEAKFKGI